MDSTPPSNRSDPKSRLKSASRLSRITNFDGESDEIPQFSLHLVPSSPKVASNHSPNSLPLRELLLLSPSPLGRSKTRLAQRLELAEDAVEAAGTRRRHRNRNAAINVVGCASPRSSRKSRKRLEHEIREEKDLGVAEEMPKPRKRRHSGRSKKDKLSLVPSNPSPITNDGERCNLDQVGQLMTDLIMWKDMAKSTLWFGLGSLCFLSSCFAGGVSFSIFSMMSQLSLLFLGVSFFSNSICQRDSTANKPQFELKEDDIFRAARLLLPAANLVISRTRRLFSGEPSMTLKVAPFLLIGAEYGHLITLWRLCAFGFLIGFTGPKLYSCYSLQINKKVEYLKKWGLEAWGTCSHKKMVSASAVTAFWNLTCSHKKMVSASAVTAFWNLTSIRTRIIAGFISLVILRYYRQHSKVGEQEQHQALVVVETGSHDKCL